MVSKDKTRVYISLPKPLLANLRRKSKDLEWTLSGYITYICNYFFRMIK